MKCFYEVLEVSRDVNADELKKSYKKLALKWHPDKNPGNADEAKERFQLIQQAYEVLGDPRERRWYDDHRETIISGCGGAPADAVDLFRYFSPSCYKGFGDDDAGFYAVYRRVFVSLLDEEMAYCDGDEPDETPTFGRSDSDYATVVRPFYDFWRGYGTRKPFGWLDEYDARQAPNRRVAKLMEKENKKIRDRAKRQRNDEIRALVEFVRKRDERVKAHAEALRARSAEHGERMEEARRKRIRDRRKELADYEESDWSRFSNVEDELRAIEESLIAEHDGGGEVGSDDENCLYCVACNKVFKTEKAFENHENSKKHRENVQLIRVEMWRDEERAVGGRSSDEERAVGGRSSDDDASSSESAVVASDADCDVSVARGRDASSGGAEVKRNGDENDESTDDGPRRNEPDPDDASSEADSSGREDDVVDVKKNGKRSPAVDVARPSYCATCERAFKTEKALRGHRTSKKHRDNAVRLTGVGRIDDDDDVPPESADRKAPDAAAVVDVVEPPGAAVEQSTKRGKKADKVKSDHACAVCSSAFSSKNKLHRHLKDANHAVLKTAAAAADDDQRRCGKKRRK